MQGDRGEVVTYTGDVKVDTLLKRIKEFIEQVQGVADDFASIEKIAHAAKTIVEDKNKIGSYSYRTNFGKFFGNMVKPWVESKISQEQYDKLFEAATWHMGVGFMMSKQLKDILEEIKNVKTTEQAAVVVKKFYDRISPSLGSYLEAIHKAPQIQTTFMDLKKYQQDLLDSTAKESANVVLGTDKGIVAHPFQHIGRIPLLLNDIVKDAQKCDQPEIQEVGKALEVQRDESKDILAEINKELPKVKFK